jgi:valyl-tRNA synthetase
VTLLDAAANPPQSAVQLVGTLSLLVPMAGLIDARAEAERLGKLLTRSQRELEKIHSRLGNESFVRGAPPEVVAGERERAAELERTVSGLAAQLQRVRGLAAP